MQERLITVPATLDSKSVSELAAAIDAAVQNDTVGAVVLQGSVGTFCQGLDLDEIVGLAAEQQALRQQSVADYGRCLRALRLSDKVSLALVEGATRGGGIGLVAACDVVLASDRATFGLPEVLFGLAPAMVLPFLLERVSVKTARLWALTGVTRTAKEAMAEGLVDVVVSSANLATELRQWLKMLRRGQRRGIRTIKHLCAVMPAMDRAAALELGQQTTLEALNDTSVISAITRFKTEGVLPWEPV